MGLSENSVSTFKTFNPPNRQYNVGLDLRVPKFQRNSYSRKNIYIYIHIYIFHIHMHIYIYRYYKYVWRCPCSRAIPENWLGMDSPNIKWMRTANPPLWSQLAGLLLLFHGRLWIWRRRKVDLLLDQKRARAVFKTSVGCWWLWYLTIRGFNGDYTD